MDQRRHCRQAAQCKIKQQWSSISCLLMLGIQDYRWKRSQLTTTKTARFHILERIGSLELMRTETVAGKLLLLRQNCKFSGKSGALRANLLVFRQNWVFLIPFDLLLMRLPSLLSPSTHCQSWFGFCVIWSYGGHMKQVAQLVPI